MTYKGPSDNDRIDSPMLSRILYFMNNRLPKGTKLCLLGGSALTYLGVRDSGSEDVDFIPMNNEADISDALHYINDTLSRRKISIEIQEYGITKEQFMLPKNAHVQNLGFNLPSANLPDEFKKRAHKMKKIPWVMPEGGKETSFPTRKILKHIEVYTPDLLDMFMIKLFASRKKDQEDLHSLLGSIAQTERFYKKYSKELHERLYEYLEKNRKRIESRKALNLYVNLQKKYTYLEPLNILRAENYMR